MEVLTRDQIGRLTPPEQLSLISQLWDSLVADKVPVSPEQQAELDRRLESLARDREDAIPWADLKRDLEQRCP